MGIFWKHLLLCTLIALLSKSAAEKYSYKDILEQDTDLSKAIDFRLPTSVKPIKYEIILSPELKNKFKFEGTVKITALVNSATDTITLHRGNVTIKERTVLKGISGPNLYLSESYDNVTEKYTLKLSETLKKDTKITIALEYEGILNDKMIGFYRSSYIGQDGETKWLAATQFQPTHARHAFPCFDEPSLKAIFEIRIARGENYKCLSNMPLAKTEKLEGVQWDTFEESIPMSTYLVAFVIAEFEYLQAIQPLELSEFRVWAKPSSINQAKYALEIGVEILQNLSVKFDQKYDLPKMDMVAIPDFAAGAMENWGLVTYREARMLYDEKESSSLAQQSVFSVIAHELVHMWFGNLVTPEWWSYLWLSEGFARYFQNFGIETPWNMTEQFVVDQHQTALIADGFESSRPMTWNVSSQSEIGQMGGIITYSKGASIIRMMSFMFKTKFEPALRDYLKKNTEKGLGNPDALWEALQAQVKFNVKKVMDTWTTQAGYPVVTVNISDKGRVTQQRFFLRNLDNTPTKMIWEVPLTWTKQKNSDFDDTTTKAWLNIQEGFLDPKSTIFNPKEWVIFNVQSSGFYRVNYDKDGWQRILDVLKDSTSFTEIHEVNRAAIMDDLLNLARAKLQNYELVLDALTYLKHEENYLPFKAVLNGLDYLNKRLTGYNEHHLFKKYVLSLIEEQRKKLGYEDRKDDDTLTVLLRRELNNWACKLDSEECIATYMNKFEKWRTQTLPNITPNERTTAYCVAVKKGTLEDWEYLWDKYRNANNEANQVVILNALGCSLDTKILEKYLISAITKYEDSRIRKHDSANVFAAVYSSSLVGAEYVLDFIDRHYKEMITYYEGQSTLATILDGVSQHLSTSRLVDKFQEFIQKHRYETEFEPIITSLQYSLKIAKYDLEWYKSVSIPIVQWLQKYDDRLTDNEDMTKYRLPEDIKPLKYEIFVKPYFNNFTFYGNVKIDAKVKKETNKIVLHSAEIEHRKVIVKVNDKEVEIDSKYPVSKYNFYEINLVDKIKSKENLTIEIEYTGNLNAPDLRGFYKSSYVNGKEKRWLAATHLEPVGARRLFPCFDEPAMKAKFTIKVNVPPNYHALSNMDGGKEKIKDEDGRETFVFTESKTMSTYLVAIVVSDFIAESKGTPTIKHSVFARPNAKGQTTYALSVMDDFVRFFEEKLNKKYELPKLDMIALPDFPSGAMENWGLLTYRETSLLYDENHSPMTNQQSIRNVIAHEIAHQWFGNLVSPEWWKYLWLNEGFAAYFQYHAAAHIYNDATMEPQFVVDQIHSALKADSSISTHPITHDVFSPSQINGIFDSISYGKAASILRMVEKSFGNDLFYDALSDYLKKKEYDVATAEDLYAALQYQIYKAGRKENIQVILDTWTTQSGYPVLHVDIENNKIILQQERFFFKKPENPSADPIPWHIPITWEESDVSNHNTVPKFWFIDEEREISPNPGESYEKVMVFNVLQSGFYRVNYKEKHWLKLANHLISDNSIDPINRAVLIDDIMNLARANYVDYNTVALFTMQYLNNEMNYYPWRAFYNNLPYLNNRLRGREMEDLYKKYLISVIQPLYTKLGFKEEEGKDTVARLNNMLRIYTREWACKLDIADCKLRAAQYFLQKQINSQPIPPNYRGVVYCTAMRTDTTKTSYNFLWKEYLNNNLATDKLVILSSLACSQNKDILKELLLTAVKEDGIRYQDSAKVFSDVYDASLIGMEVVMTFIKDNYDIMHQRFGGDFTKIQNIVSALANRLSTYKLYDQYQSLLDWLVIKEPAFMKFVDSYLLTAKDEFNWYESQVPEIFEGLHKLLPDDSYRLPNTLYPELYNISLIPDMNYGMFEGSVMIHMRAERNTTAIFLNSHDLRIGNIKVYETNSYKPIEILDYRINTTSQQLKIYLNSYVRSGDKLTVEIKFSGILNDEMQGFYRSSYYDKEGHFHWLATTQFEPTYARSAFPCFDEPAFKSKFMINIRRPKHYNTLSNMPVYHIDDKNSDYDWDTFRNTTEMSPYLVAFVISEFKGTEESWGYIDVWGRPEVIEHGSYARDIATLIITKLEEFTGIAYSLPKLDLVGIPDFKFGAMENWGLSTFREYALFHHKDETTGTYEKYIITTIAHELAHMWFGNLVTCEWWEYIWLNEGFAEYFQWYIADQVRSNYNFMDQYVVYELHAALLKDSADSVHPMTNPVETPQEINDIFDYVTYGKSSSILRMLFNAFDDEQIHKQAIKDYLQNHASGTVRPTDLWKSFEPYVTIKIGLTKVSVEEVMDSWTNQPGYPVVHANLDNSVLTLIQERFKLKRDKLAGTEYYWIPIQVVTSSDGYPTSQHKLWLGPEPQTMYINPNNEWYIVNYKQTGFYRVNYDSANWIELIKELNSDRFGTIHVLNRAQIIDDLFNLAHAGYVDYDLLMNATKYLTRETNHLPWKAFFNGISHMYEKYENQDYEKELKEYILNITSPIYNKVEFDDKPTDHHLDELNRELVLQWACKLEQPQCVKKSIELFTAWRDDPSKKIPRNARAAVYCTAVKQGSLVDWQFLWYHYVTTNFASEKKLIINALGCSRDEEILQNYIRKALNDGKGHTVIRKQDVLAVFASVYNSGHFGVNVTLDFLMDNVPELYRYFGNWKEIGNLFRTVSSHVSTWEQYNKLLAFFSANARIFPELVKDLAASLDIMRTTLQWYNKNGETIATWIEKQKETETEEPSEPDIGSAVVPMNIIFVTILALIPYFLNYR